MNSMMVENKSREEFPVLHVVGPMGVCYEKKWHPFSDGRPLWRSLFEANETNPQINFLVDIVEYAGSYYTNNN
jgi:hypothetical protein